MSARALVLALLPSLSSTAECPVPEAWRTTYILTRSASLLLCFASGPAHGPLHPRVHASMPCRQHCTSTGLTSSSPMAVVGSEGPTGRPLAGVNDCSVRVTHTHTHTRTPSQPVSPIGRDVQEPTSLQTINDACVPLLAIPALRAARHVQTSRLPPPSKHARHEAASTCSKICSQCNCSVSAPMAADTRGHRFCILPLLVWAG